MKIYGERRTSSAMIPTTETNEIYYIFESVPQNTKKLKRQQRRTGRNIVVVGIILAAGIWELCRNIKEQRKDLEKIKEEIEKQKEQQDD